MVETARAMGREAAPYLPDLWGLQDEQLAKSCVLLAQGCIPEADAFQRAEAVRLFLMWRDAMHRRRRSLQALEEQASLLAALRKRTVQVLVALHAASQPVIPER